MVWPWIAVSVRQDILGLLIRCCTCSKGIISQLQIIKAWMLKPKHCQFVPWSNKAPFESFFARVVSNHKRWKSYSFEIKSMGIESIRFVQLHIELQVHFSNSRFNLKIGKSIRQQRLSDCVTKYNCITYSLSTFKQKTSSLSTNVLSYASLTKSSATEILISG